MAGIQNTNLLPNQPHSTPVPQTPMYAEFEPSNGPSHLPAHALYAGHDVDGSQIYLGRARFMQDILIAKVIPAKNAAYIALNGQEMPVAVVDVLQLGPHSWRPGKNGEIPTGAIHVGTSSSGEWLYAGRAHYQGSITPGTVHPTNNCMFMPFGGKAIPIFEYEVLCNEHGM